MIAAYYSLVMHNNRSPFPGAASPSTTDREVSLAIYTLLWALKCFEMTSLESPWIALLNCPALCTYRKLVQRLRGVLVEQDKVSRRHSLSYIVIRRKSFPVRQLPTSIEESPMSRSSDIEEEVQSNKSEDSASGAGDAVARKVGCYAINELRPRNPYRFSIPRNVSVFELLCFRTPLFCHRRYCAQRQIEQCHRSRTPRFTILR